MRVYWHDEALAHDTGSGMFDQPPTPLIEVPELHPENPERIRNIRSTLRNGPIAPRREWQAGRHASREGRERTGPAILTQSTPVVPASWGAALGSAGTALAATDAVLAGDSDPAYALLRPPG